MIAPQINRLSVIRDLLEISRPLAEISAQLSTLDWDYEGDGEKLTRYHLASALQRYLDNSLSASDIEAWANLIEFREDVSFEEDHYQQIEKVLHELANPLLTQPLDLDRAAVLRASLDLYSVPHT
jgi:hypothetical protein